MPQIHVPIPWRRKPPPGVPLDSRKKSGILGYYAFNEAGGDPRDLSGNGNHGTWNGTGQHWARGVATLDGSSDYVDVGTGVEVLGDHTIIAHLKVDDNSLRVGIVGNLILAGLLGYTFEMVGAGGGAAGELAYFNAGTGWEHSTAIVASGIWTTVAVAVDVNVGVRFYIDGIDVGGVADTSSAPNSGAASTKIGQNYIGQEFGGEMDVVMIFNRCLNPSKIAQISSNPWHLHEPMVIPVPVAAVPVTFVPQINMVM